MNTSFFNASRETHLLVRTNEFSNDYLTLRRGVIEIETISHEDATKSLVPAPKANQNLKKNAQTLLKSVLPKTPLALACLNLIVTNENPDQTDFLTTLETSMKDNTKAKTTSKKTKKEPALRKQDGYFALADLARELSLDPRDIRAKFRKANMTKPEGGWVFENHRRDEITALVKSDKPLATPAKTTKTPAKTTKTAPKADKKAPKAKTSKPKKDEAPVGHKAQKASRKPSKVIVTKGAELAATA